MSNARTRAIDAAILHAIPHIRERDGACTVTALAESTGYPRATVYRRLRMLYDQGVVWWRGFGSIRLTNSKVGA